MIRWKVYVSARFEEKERAFHFQRRLQQAGHSITYDWTWASDVTRQQAELDVTGVVECDAFILLEPLEGGRGSWFEFGIAWALDKRMILVRRKPEPADPCIFTLLSDVEIVGSEEEAIDLLQHETSHNTERRIIG